MLWNMVMIPWFIHDCDFWFLCLSKWPTLTPRCVPWFRDISLKQGSFSLWSAVSVRSSFLWGPTIKTTACREINLSNGRKSQTYSITERTKSDFQTYHSKQYNISSTQASCTWLWILTALYSRQLGSTELLLFLGKYKQSGFLKD